MHEAYGPVPVAGEVERLIDVEIARIPLTGVEAGWIIGVAFVRGSAGREKNTNDEEPPERDPRSFSDVHDSRLRHFFEKSLGVSALTSEAGAQALDRQVGEGARRPDLGAGELDDVDGGGRGLVVGEHDRSRWRATRSST